MKGFIMFGFALAITMVVMGCAKDRAGCSGCSSSAASTFGQNSASGSNSSSSVAARSDSPDNVFQHKLCPVTGEPLDSMGGAIAVEANGSTIFVCCQGCVKSVKNDPEKYLAIARAE